MLRLPAAPVPQRWHSEELLAERVDGIDGSAHVHAVQVYAVAVGFYAVSLEGVVAPPFSLRRQERP